MLKHMLSDKKCQHQTIHQTIHADYYRPAIFTFVFTLMGFGVNPLKAEALYVEDMAERVTETVQIPPTEVWCPGRKPVLATSRDLLRCRDKFYSFFLFRMTFLHCFFSSEIILPETSLKDKVGSSIVPSIDPPTLSTITS
jgi:hypothetical protein